MFFDYAVVKFDLGQDIEHNLFVVCFRCFKILYFPLAISGYISLYSSLKETLLNFLDNKFGWDYYPPSFWFSIGTKYSRIVSIEMTFKDRRDLEANYPEKFI